MRLQYACSLLAIDATFHQASDLRIACCLPGCPACVSLVAAPLVSHHSLPSALCLISSSFVCSTFYLWSCAALPRRSPSAPLSVYFGTVFCFIAASAFL